MVTIISGTNRQGSNTRKVANYYYNILKEELDDVHFVSLEDYETHQRTEEFINLEKNILIPSQTFIFFFPEYNGSYPGVLKSLIDNSDIRKAWWHKKAMLVGIADGRGGNLRGLDQFSNVLHYLKILVHPNKLPLSKISNELDTEGIFKNDLTKAEVRKQIDDLINFVHG